MQHGMVYRHGVHLVTLHLRKNRDDTCALTCSAWLWLLLKLKPRAACFSVLLLLQALQPAFMLRMKTFALDWLLELITFLCRSGWTMA